MTELLDRPQKRTYHYVTFTYGSGPTVKKYTNWLDPADGSFTPVPTLEVTPDANVGTLEDKQFRIALPVGDAFTTWVSADEPKAPIVVDIVERLEDPLGILPAETLKLFHGRLFKAVRNTSNRSTSVLLYAQNVKQALAVKLGMIASEQCAFIFGGKGCKIDLGPLKKNGTLHAVDNTGRIATVTGLPMAPDTTYWRRGSLAFDGLAIAIRDWVITDAQTFVLANRVPAAWLGQVVVATPGCDLSYGQCVNRWANGARFGGFGAAMPDYNPNYEGA